MPADIKMAAEVFSSAHENFTFAADVEGFWQVLWAMRPYIQICLKI
jgi:hypothetical protein